MKVNSELSIERFDPSGGVSVLLFHDLMEMEQKCFPPSIQSDWEEVKSLIEGSVSCYFVYDNHGGLRKVVGSAYAIPLEKPDDIDSDDPHRDYWLELIKRYEGQQVAYLYSISVHPEYQGKDLSKRLMISLLSDLKAHGYTKLLSHANEGVSLHLHDFFGAKHIDSIQNWYGTNHQYTFCEIDLKELHLIPLSEPFMQEKGFDCGIACLETVLHYHRIYYKDRDSLIQASGVTNQGTRHEGMIAAIEAFWYRPIIVSGLMFLTSLLSAGRLVIMHVLSPGTYEGHYVVAVGMNLESLYVWEPYDGLFGRMSWQEVGRIWWNNTYRNTWGISIHEHQPTEK